MDPNIAACQDSAESALGLFKLVKIRNTQLVL
jgi:hypothetical protein